MASATASVQDLERRKDGRWQLIASKKDAVLGRTGIAWSWAFKSSVGK
jgi:hypothetical protein